MAQFKDSTIIVTGGGRGIGRGITTAFAEEGANVIICGRREPEAFPANIAGQIHFTSLDIREAEAADALMQFAIEKTGRVDVLINNAGGSPYVAAADASPRLTESVIRLNLTAPLWLSQAAHKVMTEKNTKGSIVNISSVSAIRPSPGTAAYGAAKAGLSSATTSLAMEWAPDVRVNAITVGLVKTEAAADHYGGEKGIAHLSGELPMKRMAAPSDIAKACLFLAHPDNSYVSGACLEVHGGGEPPSFLKIAQEAIKQGQSS